MTATMDSVKTSGAKYSLASGIIGRLKRMKP